MMWFRRKSLRQKALEAQVKALHKMAVEYGQVSANHNRNKDNQSAEWALKNAQWCWKEIYEMIDQQSPVSESEVYSEETVH